MQKFDIVSLGSRRICAWSRLCSRVPPQLSFSLGAPLRRGFCFFYCFVSPSTDHATNFIERLRKGNIFFGIKCFRFPRYSKHEFEKVKARYKFFEIWELDRRIQETEPYKLIKTDTEKAKEIIAELVSGLFEIATHLEPFMPETAEKIKTAIQANKMPAPLFARKV